MSDSGQAEWLGLSAVAVGVGVGGVGDDCQKAEFDHYFQKRSFPWN